VSPSGGEEDIEVLADADAAEIDEFLGGPESPRRRWKRGRAEGNRMEGARGCGSRRDRRRGPVEVGWLQGRRMDGFGLEVELLVRVETVKGGGSIRTFDWAWPIRSFVGRSG
jgi:hypothetical protein